MAQPAVVSALTGPSSLDHLEENLAASRFTLASEEPAELVALFAREDEAVAAFRRERIAAILAAPLDADPDVAVRDLVFVLEAAADLASAQRLLRESLKL
ncbi:MAG: hypothetical protein ACYC53_09580 [Bacillota bacterium]